MTIKFTCGTNTKKALLDGQRLLIRQGDSELAGILENMSSNPNHDYPHEVFIVSLADCLGGDALSKLRSVGWCYIAPTKNPVMVELECQPESYESTFAAISTGGIADEIKAMITELENDTSMAGETHVLSLVRIPELRVHALIVRAEGSFNSGIAVPIADLGTSLDSGKRYSFKEFNDIVAQLAREVNNAADMYELLE